MSEYSQHWLWYLPPDVSGLAPPLARDMAVALSSYANVSELFELLRIIYWTRFDTIQSTWRELKSWDADCHPARTGKIRDFVYYDPWVCLKTFE